MSSPTARLCILCLAEPATTAEHFFKADIFRDMFPDGKAEHQYVDQGPISRRRIQGPNSKLLKAKSKNLCANCNNVRSQKADRAFSELDFFLRRNMLTNSDSSQNIDFETVLGQARMSEARSELSRYLAKHLACLLERHGTPVPASLRLAFICSQELWRLQVKIRAIEHLFKQSLMTNSGPDPTIAGLQKENVRNLLALGVLPEKIAATIQHGPIIYEIEFSTPENEVIDSASSTFFSNINALIESKSLPWPANLALKGVSLWLKLKLTWQARKVRNDQH